MAGRQDTLGIIQKFRMKWIWFRLASIMCIIIMGVERSIIGPIEREEDNMQIDLDTVLKEDISEEIKKNEHYSRIKFPQSYIDFIKEYNVGVPVTKYLPFYNNVYVVERFLGFVKDYKNSELGCYDIGVVLSQLYNRLTDKRELAGDELIPIAVLFAGDFICLDFRNEAAAEPEVCIWYHEESEEFAPVTRKVADTFEEFLTMLE